MQQIERYGVIALVFLLVTIVAVSFWGDGKSPGFWSRLTGRGDAKRIELAKNTAIADRAVENALPLNAPAAPNAGEQSPQPPAPNAPPPAAPQSAESAIANANANAGGAPIAAAKVQAGGDAPVAAPAPKDAASLAGSPAAHPAASSAPLVVANAKDPHVATKNTAVPSAVPSSTSTVEYVVQKGDSLASIAQRNLGNSNRWGEIQSLNNGIQPRSLRVGMHLKLPATATASATAAEHAPKAETSAPKKAAPAVDATHTNNVYVVKTGDTLRSIADKKLGSPDRWKDIVAANPGLDTHKLVVGKTLKLPAESRDARDAHDSRPLVAAALPSNTGKPHVR
jgi:nucleoid-associated protein YgaU